jgi:hypothetical protein
MLQIDELDPRSKDVQGTGKSELAWPAGENECASALRITDVIAPPPPASGDGPRFVVIVVLATSWGPHAESAGYFAGFARFRDRASCRRIRMERNGLATMTVHTVPTLLREGMHERSGPAAEPVAGPGFAL